MHSRVHVVAPVALVVPLRQGMHAGWGLVLLPPGEKKPLLQSTQPALGPVTHPCPAGQMYKLQLKPLVLPAVGVVKLTPQSVHTAPTPPAL